MQLTGVYQLERAERGGGGGGGGLLAGKEIRVPSDNE